MDNKLQALLFFIAFVISVSVQARRQGGPQLVEETHLPAGSAYLIEITKK